MLNNDYLLNKSWERINRLTNQTQELLDYQKQYSELKVKLESNREKVKQMREEREQLLATLKSEYKTDTKFNFVLPENITENQKRILGVLKQKLEILEPKKQVYRFLGKSLIKLPDEPNLLGIRLETFYQGQFYKPFYLLFSKQGEDGLKLERHTLPSHVPIQFLTEKYLDSHLEKLVEICHEYVINYVKSLHESAEDGVAEISHPNGLSEDFNILNDTTFYL